MLGAEARFPLPGATVLTTRTWRIAWYPHRTPAGPLHRLYVTAHPDCFPAVIQAVVPVVEESGPACRVARDCAVLARLNREQDWAGKAITLYFAGTSELQRQGARLDAQLAGQGLSGPVVTGGARPLGHRSGLVYAAFPHVAREEAGGGRRSRLADLLRDPPWGDADDEG